jgi:IS5 family transposase
VTSPKLLQVEQRTGQVPEHLLADGGHATLGDIKQCAARGVAPLISVPKRMAQAKEQAPEVEAWREHMRTDEARERYKARASLVENVNAQVKGRYGLTQLTVRGLAKVRSVALLVALAHNLAAHGQHLVDALRAHNTPCRVQAQPHPLPLVTPPHLVGNTLPAALPTHCPGGT